MSSKDDAFDFGYRLKELREQRQLTQAQVAKKLGVRRATIGSYENNTSTPSLQKIARLALLYHTTTDYIIGIDNRKTIILDGFSSKEVATITSIIDVVINEIKALRL